jgi:uncharacterized cupin superfamily protein
MTERRHPKIVNLDELDARDTTKGRRFGARVKPLGAAAGARGVGASWYEVEPGRAAFPHHFHCANEEAVFVLEGAGTLRLGEERLEVRAGDWVTLPVGPEHPHQLINTGATVLRYLCLSTLIPTEIAGYPDSKKIGALAAASREEALKGQHWVRLLAREGSSLDYYDGEETD